MHPGHRFAMLLRKAYLTFHRRINARLMKLGVTADQFVALSAVADDEGLTQSALVEITASDPNTVTAILRLLERRGLVRREIHATDRRSRCVFLTPQGRRVQRQAARLSEPLLAALHECIEPSARGHVEASMQDIRARFCKQQVSRRQPTSSALGRPANSH